MEVYKNNNRKWLVHSKEDCSGKCPLHKPSSHHMVDWPIFIRSSGLIERTCEHGVGHPDPDSLDYLDPDGNLKLGIHGCDGCCSGR